MANSRFSGMRVRCTNSRELRRGATILEVMFAIFVVIVGLMGIASLLPLAARNAEQSNAYNQALAQGQNWLNDFLARGFNRPNSLTRRGSGFNWQWYNDTAFNVNNVQVPIGFYNFSKRGIQNVPGNVLPNSFVTPSNAAVTSSAGTRIWGRQSVCLDPVFMSDPDVVQNFNTTAGRYQSYRASVFPYFEDGHNPIEDAFAAPTAAWPDQPRMIRATLGGGAGQIPNKFVKDLFVSGDDVATFINDEDKSIPATRLFSQGGVKALTTGDYTWMATLTPEPVAAPAIDTQTTDYILSLVVLQRRDKQFIAPGATPTAGSADNKPQGERLVWVQPLSGDFTGGAGGRVRLLSNRAVEDRLHVGDWIMFGKHFAINPMNTAQRFSYFRWFRIIAIDAEPKLGSLQDLSPTGTDPFGNAFPNTVVWSRDVVVEGSDWTFYSTPDPTGATLGQEAILVNGQAIPVPTTGTIMSNVVTVIERNVTVD